MTELYDYSSYRNIHAGRRCFIIGTGPSLLSIDMAYLSRLEGEITFGVNYLLKIPGFPFLPTYSSATEYDHLTDIETCIYRAEKRLQSKTNRWMSNPEPISGRASGDWKWVYRDHDLKMWEGEFRGFELYPTELPFERVAWGRCATLNLPVQLACWMGFSEVYLLGCETTETGYAYDREVDRNDNVALARQSAGVAAEVMRGWGRRLVDLTEGGTLPITRMRLEEVL